ncbi:FMN-dependent NADH-azoreductase [Alkalithermobacter paradoxus]|uniref:FMN dependent NADH:quinone oxidoreductase n=1 Tax=Alkalithermobacter paradoxus TaxID=29349 RepID=A0A1V4I8I6_9FIRM|nr:FMN-dependent NADH-azoreductase 2 [[Clostridium] thermoalcaliphilum]
MAKLLYIVANPKVESQSYSLQVGDEFLDIYKSKNPNDEVVELDLYKIDIPYIDEDVFNGWGKLAKGEDLTDSERKKIDRINQLSDEFVSADKYVFINPMWNFSIPPIMKAYIDTICIAGKTFKYTEDGPIGLLDNKKALHIQSSGDIYYKHNNGEVDFGDKYIRFILNFLGITSIESIFIEGMGKNPSESDEIKQEALKRAKDIAHTF